MKRGPPRFTRTETLFPSTTLFRVWATFVQVYDPDRIDTPAEQVGNPNVREGQIFDKWNRRVGTFVRKAHPSDYLAGLADMDFEMVPRENMETGRPIGPHWFIKTRAAQLRGVSTLVTNLKSSVMLNSRSEEHTSELQPLMRSSYAVFFLQKKHE